MSLSGASLLILGVLVVALAALSVAATLSTLTRREYEDSAARWERAAEAWKVTAETLKAWRVRGTLELADGTSMIVEGETIADIVAACLPGPIRRPPGEEIQDPWTSGIPASA